MPNRDEFLALFRTVQPKFSRFYARLLNKADLTISQYALLQQLATAGTVPMTEISCKLHISKPAVTNLVDRLEKKQLIKRLPHPKDRRVHLLQIQPKGKKIVHELQAQVLHTLMNTVDQLKPEEQKSVTKFYSILSQKIDETLNQNC